MARNCLKDSQLLCGLNFLYGALHEEISVGVDCLDRCDHLLRPRLCRDTGRKEQGRLREGRRRVGREGQQMRGQETVNGCQLGSPKAPNREETAMKKISLIAATLVG